MSLFRYTAVDAAGRSLAGETDAPTLEDARRQLEGQGYSAIDFTSADPKSTASVADVFGADSAAVAGSISLAVSSGLPLANGLRALAEEAVSSRTRSALRGISDRVAAGESLDAALERTQGSLPPVLAAVIRAGQRSGRLPLALTRYVDLARESRELRHSIWAGSLYPLALLIACVGVFTLLVGFVIPMFDAMFDDFDMELPGLTVTVIHFSRFAARYGLWVLFGGVVLAAVGGLTLHAVVSPQVRALVLDQIPLIGWMRRNFAIARFCRMLALLMDGGTPFPEALRLAGATAHSGFAAGANRLADDVEQGIPPEDAVRRIPVFPKWLTPVFRWHDRGTAFAEALDAAADMCIDRSQAQLTVATLIAEPAVIVCIAVTIALVLISLFLPLFSLLNVLS